MIDESLLRASGNITALRRLSRDGPHTASELTEPMDLTKQTVRQRMETLADHTLVRRDAELRDTNPVTVYELTDDGETVATTLRALLSDGDVDRALLPQSPDADAESHTQDEFVPQTPDESTTPDDGGTTDDTRDRPPGLSFETNDL